MSSRDNKTIHGEMENKSNDPNAEGESSDCREKAAISYIREKVDQLLEVIGTVPLKPDELDDATLIELDPIGIISNTFSQILDHLHETNLELEEAKDEIEAIFESVGEGILVLNSRREIIAYNKKMKNLFIDTATDILGNTCRQVVCEGQTSEYECIARRVFSQERSIRVRSWKCRGRYYEIIGTPIVDKTGEVKRIVILYMDVTRRKKTEIALVESEDRYRDLFENASDMLMVMDPEGRIMVVNQAWRDKLGYSESESKQLTIFDILHPEYMDVCKEHLEKILNDKKDCSTKTVFTSRNGREIIVDARVNCRFVDDRPVALRCVFRDITEQTRMQEEMQRTQKLESVGLLAGGIAHDFNNLLTGILGNIHLARLKSPDSEIDQLLQATENASERAQDLTRQLLTFSKGGAPVKETASIVEIVRDVTGFMLRGSKTGFEVEVNEPVSAVEVDPGQFSQVLQNLVLNSDQAMPDGGIIRISVSDYIVDDRVPVPLPLGKYVRIVIEDQGIGIAREYLSRIFDPYFSTKKKGSGLGLATCYSIIRNHNGLITVDSEPGSGTTMTIYIPASKAKLEKKDGPLGSVTHGSGKILVMDDDEIVRKVAVQMLSHLGYEITESEDGREAVEKYTTAMQNGEPFDAVILDLTVPGGMGGMDTMKELLEIDPAVKAIVSSGYSNDPIMAEFSRYGFSGVVPKPYSMDKLSTTIHRIISV